MPKSSVTLKTIFDGFYLEVSLVAKTKITITIALNKVNNICPLSWRNSRFQHKSNGPGIDRRVFLQNKRHSTSSWRSRSTNRLLMSTRVFHRKGFPFDKNRSVVNLVLSFMACCAELAGRGCRLLHRCVFLPPCSTLLLKLRLSDKETRRTRGACVPPVQVEGRGGRSGTYACSHTSSLYYAKATVLAA